MNASQHEHDDRDVGHSDELHAMETVPHVARFGAGAEETCGRETFVMPIDQRADSVGARLRAAREAREMDLEQAASRLRLPQRVLQAIEADDYSRIEHGVYLRGYLTSYARLLGLPESELGQSALQDRQAPPPLVATGRISHSRYLYQRYSVPAVYLLLTGLIVGPSVWLATHGGLERNLVRLSTLDAPVTASGTSTPVALPPPATDNALNAAVETDTAAVAPIEEPRTAAMPVPAAKPADQQPLMASLAPFTTAVEPTPAASKPATAGEHHLHLKLSEASWVEIGADDGRKLEYGLLQAGAERDYYSAAPLSVRIGNAGSAEVVLDGKSADLAPYRHSNVAYFHAFGAKGDIAGAE